MGTRSMKHGASVERVEVEQVEDGIESHEVATAGRRGNVDGFESDTSAGS
jgi:hypothetical protein